MNGEDQRKARLAQALRDNLRRRKAQSREEQAQGKPAAFSDQTDPSDSLDDIPPA
jgi:hypothetical protein